MGLIALYKELLGICEAVENTHTGLWQKAPETLVIS